MKENREDDYNGRPITPDSGVRLSVGLIATMVLGFAYFLYARDEFFYDRYQIYAKAHEDHVSGELRAIKEELKGKAAKSTTEDRFTGKDFRTFETSHIREREQFKESVESKFNLINEKNEIQHRALNDRIDHLEHDLESSEKRIDQHYLNK